MSPLNLFLTEAITTQYLVASLFFLRYASKTSDRFFGFFATAFMILAAERIVWLLLGTNSEIRPMLYMCRLVAFSLIICAVYWKNRQSRQGN